MDKKFFSLVLLFAVLFFFLGCTAAPPISDWNAPVSDQNSDFLDGNGQIGDTNSLVLPDANVTRFAMVSLQVFDDSNKLVFKATKQVKIGTNGLEALKLLADNNIESVDYSFGTMVTAIKGIKSDSARNYWAFLVDGNYSSKGIKDYTIVAPLKMDWRLTSLSEFLG